MNSALIEQFVLLQKYYAKKGDVGRRSAYGRAVIALKEFDRVITHSSQVKNVKGIGSGIKSKIQEYLDTGRINEVEKAKKELETAPIPEKEKVITLFQTVHGIGKIKAKKLYDQGLKTISDLKKNPQLLDNSSILFLKHYDDLQQRIPRVDITVINVILVYLISKQLGENFKLDIAGSYRRQAQNSKDIDCLITSSSFNLKEIVDALKRSNVIIETLGMKGEKFLGIGRCPGGGRAFRLDIQFVSESEYGSALLYFTGSADFNKRMRYNAHKQGLLLNEHGLFKENKKVLRSPSERDIFEYLGMPFVPPEKR